MILIKKYYFYYIIIIIIMNPKSLLSILHIENNEMFIALSTFVLQPATEVENS